MFREASFHLFNGPQFLNYFRETSPTHNPTLWTINNNEEAFVFFYILTISVITHKHRVAAIRSPVVLQGRTPISSGKMLVFIMLIIEKCSVNLRFYRRPGIYYKLNILIIFFLVILTFSLTRAVVVKLLLKTLIYCDFILKCYYMSADVDLLQKCFWRYGDI